MKLSILYLFVLLALTGFNSCKSKDSGNTKLEGQLVSINDMYDKALVSHDTAALKNIYADDLIYTTAEGKVLNKSQQLNSILLSEMKLNSGKSSDVKVRLLGNSALVTGLFQAEGTFRGNPISINERYTTVWNRTDTSWVLIAEHASIVR